jgi:hypothetical protein
MQECITFTESLPGEHGFSEVEKQVLYRVLATLDGAKTDVVVAQSEQTVGSVQHLRQSLTEGQRSPPGASPLARQPYGCTGVLRLAPSAPVRGGPNPGRTTETPIH